MKREVGDFDSCIRLLSGGLDRARCSIREFWLSLSLALALVLAIPRRRKERRGGVKVGMGLARSSCVLVNAREAAMKGCAGVSVAQELAHGVDAADLVESDSIHSIDSMDSGDSTEFVESVKLLGMKESKHTNVPFCVSAFPIISAVSAVSLGLSFLPNSSEITGTLG